MFVFISPQLCFYFIQFFLSSANNRNIESIQFAEKFDFCNKASKYSLCSLLAILYHLYLYKYFLILYPNFYFLPHLFHSSTDCLPSVSLRYGLHLSIYYPSSKTRTPTPHPRRKDVLDTCARWYIHTGTVYIYGSHLSNWAHICYNRIETGNTLKVYCHYTPSQIWLPKVHNAFAETYRKYARSL